MGCSRKWRQSTRLIFCEVIMVTYVIIGLLFPELEKSRFFFEFLELFFKIGNCAIFWWKFTTFYWLSAISSEITCKRLETLATFAKYQAKLTTLGSDPNSPITTLINVKKRFLKRSKNTIFKKNLKKLTDF